MAPTPLSLLERLRSEPDEVSWRRLFELYTPLVRHWLKLRGLGPTDRDDLVQEVCAVIARELPRFDHVGRTGAFRLWIRTIVLNRLRGYWRSKRSQLDPETERSLDELADPDSHLSRLWDREHDEYVARKLLDIIRPEFAPSTWEAFRRQVLDGVPAAEAAGELGTSVNAVLIAKSRVLRRLRQEGRGLIGPLL
jgi:RNA polymerase sigma-70 factor (ECF subfamily)